MRSKKDLKVFFDLELDKKPIGRIIIMLYFQYAPKTCENFRLLCTGEAGFSDKTGKPLCFKGTIFHRIIPGFMMQGGDFTKFNGTGNESAYNSEGLPEENTDLKHSRAGIVSMAKNGTKTNGSQFFITFGPAPWLDGTYTAFGEVIKGMEICMKVENVKTDANDKPLLRVGITDCGEIVERESHDRRNRSRSWSRSKSSERSRSRSSERSRHRRNPSKKHKKHHHKNKQRRRSKS